MYLWWLIPVSGKTGKKRIKAFSIKLENSSGARCPKGTDGGNNSVSMMIQIQYSDPEAAQEIPASNVVRETVEEAESKTAAAAAEERLAKVT